jgi:hypothetical protein
LAEWRCVPSVNGLLASSDGLLMVVPHERPMPNGRGARLYGGQPIRGAWDGSRFLYRLRGRTYKVARLVCEAFRGPAPDDKPYCIHLDENAANNKIENVSWGTQKENLNAPGFIAYCRGRTGDNNPYLKGRR